MIFPSISTFSLRISLPHIPMDFVFAVDISKLYYLAVLFNLCAAICSSSPDLVIILIYIFRTLLLPKTLPPFLVSQIPARTRYSYKLTVT
jgi:hypothetical protein